MQQLIKPEGQQIEALEKIKNWLKFPTKQFTLGGYAGTGKTSLIKHIRDLISPFSAVVTYTNKAASVLRSKGISDAITIFRLMYKLIDEDNMIWHKLNELEVDVVIVDEASMLGQSIRTDLESYGVPIIYIGDPGQLPPINEESVMDKCDFTLTEVRRHGDKILEVAMAIRENRPYPDVDQFSLSDADLSSADIVICYTNNRRANLNQRIRKHRGLNGPPQKGDRVLSAKTNYNHGVFSGEIGTLIYHNGKRRFEILFDGWDEPVVFTNGHMLVPNENPYAVDLKGRDCIDFAYAMTAHKCQGSKFDKVIVWEEQRSDARWKYTAATRAVKELIMAGR